MKKLYMTLLLLVSTLFAQAAHKENFDQGWRFHYGSDFAATSPDYDDSAWRTLDLPHDWSVETEAATAVGGNVGPFTPNSIGKYETGNTVGGEGWYRKTFSLSATDLENELSLYFEGAYNQTEVWVNGTKVYFNHYGYFSFRVPIAAYCHEGNNVVAVRVVNEGNNTRWYAGSGIYRHVWLQRMPAVHVDEWETVVTTNSLTPAPSPRGEGSDYLQGVSATVNVSTLLVNEGTEQTDASLSITIVSPTGQTVASRDLTATVKAGGETPVNATFDIADALLWRPETPNLYKAVITLPSRSGGTGGGLVRFGIRTLEFSATEGFLLNGQSTLLRGGCIHHDNGLLGAAAYDRAEDRKLELLKQNGFNAVRCSHNMPSEHFLDACDSLGLMVIDEAFDQWVTHKLQNTEDNSRYFAQLSDRDMACMVRRDRNHPSIIMWSIGNEIPDRATTEGMRIAERLRQVILSYDPSRPVTAAINYFWEVSGQSWANDLSRAAASLDVIGNNYMMQEYESDHQKNPAWVMYGSESYPKEIGTVWQQVEQLSYVIGDFVWTAMDYLGEAGIGHTLYLSGGRNPQFMDYPWYNGWCGDIDLIGQKKPQSYYRDVVWRLRPITMAVEPPVPAGTTQQISGWGWQNELNTWTWPDRTSSDQMTVNVYSRSPQVRLYLNDRLVGTKSTNATFWAGFTVPYEPGSLRAVTFDGTTEGEAFTLTTAGQPAALRLTADRQDIQADNSDLSYVTIELVDAEGQVVRGSDRQVSITVNGDGTLLAAGNGSANDVASFRSATPKLYEGRALAIVKSTTTEGTVSLTVTADGMTPQTIEIKTGKNSDATGIKDLSEAPTEDEIANSKWSNSKCFDLSGRRLNTLAGHGIYIVGGKKIVR